MHMPARTHRFVEFVRAAIPLRQPFGRSRLKRTPQVTKKTLSSASHIAHEQIAAFFFFNGKISPEVLCAFGVTA
jgi:hypothetical protein